MGGGLWVVGYARRQFEALDSQRWRARGDRSTERLRVGVRVRVRFRVRIRVRLRVRLRVSAYLLLVDCVRACGSAVVGAVAVGALLE